MDDRISFEPSEDGNVVLRVPGVVAASRVRWPGPDGRARTLDLADGTVLSPVEVANVRLGLRAAGLPVGALPPSAVAAVRGIHVDIDGQNPARFVIHLGVFARDPLRNLGGPRRVCGPPRPLAPGVRWPSNGEDLPVVSVAGPAAVLWPAVADRPVTMSDPAAATVRALVAAPVGVDGLYRYQAEAVGRLEALDAGSGDQVGMVNLCAPGLGKTVITLSFLARRLRPGQVAVVAALAPLRFQWAAEAARWAPELDVRVVRSSRELPAAVAADPDRPVLAVMSVPLAAKNEHALGGEVLVVDEGGSLARSSKTTTRLRRARSRFRFASVLSGAPSAMTGRSLIELCRFVAPAAAVTAEPDQLEAICDDTTVDEIAGPLVFRRSRASVSDELPQVQITYVSSGPAPAAAGEVLGELRELCEKVQAPSSGTAGAAARAAAAPFQMRQLLSDLTRRWAQGRADVVAEVVANAGGPVVVFADGADVVEAVGAALAERDVPLMAVTGQVRDPAAAVEFLQGASGDGEARALIVSRAGSAGLNLQAAGTVVFADAPADLDVWVQRVARAARLGSVNDQVAVVVVTSDGAERALCATLGPAAAQVLAGGEPPTLTVTDLAAAAVRSSGQ